MLLKMILFPMALFASGMGVLQVSVLMESYILLAAGMVLSASGVLFGVGHQPRFARGRVLRR